MVRTVHGEWVRLVVHVLHDWCRTDERRYPQQEDIMFRWVKHDQDQLIVGCELPPGRALAEPSHPCTWLPLPVLLLPGGIGVSGNRGCKGATSRDRRNLIIRHHPGSRGAVHGEKDFGKPSSDVVVASPTVQGVVVRWQPKTAHSSRLACTRPDPPEGAAYEMGLTTSSWPLRSGGYRWKPVTNSHLHRGLRNTVSGCTPRTGGPRLRGVAGAAAYQTISRSGSTAL